MQVILKNRETRKVPKLKDILNDAINRQQKEQASKRREKEKAKDITAILSESLKPSMNESQYEMVNEQAAKLSKTFNLNRSSMESLQSKLSTVLRPVSARLKKPDSK